MVSRWHHLQSSNSLWTRCSMYTLAAVSYICVSTSSLYLSRRQDIWRWAPLLDSNSSSTTSSKTPKSRTATRHASDWLITWSVKNLSVMGRWNNENTLSIVIVISLNRRWKEDVSLCHRSTKAVKSEASSMISEHSKNARRSKTCASHLTSSSIRVWGKFFIFDPCDVTFSVERSCNKQI